MTTSTGQHADVRALVANVNRISEESLSFLELDRDLTFWARGLEATVLRGYSRRHGPVAVRVPKATHGGTGANDLATSPVELLRQEAVFAMTTARWGVPTPEIYALHVEGPLPLLVSRFVESDGSTPSPLEMAELAARIHSTDVGDLRPVNQNTLSAPAAIAERLSRRTAVLNGRVGTSFALPAETELVGLLDRGLEQRALLHMDLRSGNVLAVQGRVVGLVDWANALVGDPWIEVARLTEYGACSGEFLRRYRSLSPVPPPRPVVQDLYRLDTATMLALVFLVEAPDPAAARRAIASVRALHDRIGARL